MDGVVTVTWVDPDDGPMAGASIELSFYHEGDESPASLPAAIMGSDGAVVISGVPRPAEGAAPLLLDIRGDRSTATVDDAGCTTLEGWRAEATGVAARSRSRSRPRFRDQEHLGELPRTDAHAGRRRADADPGADRDARRRPADTGPDRDRRTACSALSARLA